MLLLEIAQSTPALKVERLQLPEVFPESEPQHNAFKFYGTCNRKGKQLVTLNLITPAF